jgi:hypothetical protein
VGISLCDGVAFWIEGVFDKIDMVVVDQSKLVERQRKSLLTGANHYGRKSEN